MGTTLRIISALSMSAINGIDSFDPAQIEGEGRGQMLAAILDELASQRSDHPASELASLHAAWQYFDKADEVEVVVLHDHQDPLHRFVVDVLDRCVAEFELLPGHVVATLRAVDAGPAPVTPGAVAEAVHRLPDATAEWLMPAPDTIVTINAAPGPTAASLLLAGLASVFEIPMYAHPGGRADAITVISTPPVALDRAATFRRLDAATEVVQLRDASASDPSTRTLVTGRPGKERLSRLSDLYVQAAVDRPMLTAYPAGAALLDRLGAPDLAERLTGLVRRWVDQRIWAFNLVPELVAHDDRHAERVDHLLATLISPVARRGKLEPTEVFLLSCAAWLHDWGHVGGIIGNGFVAHPIDVRHLHGLLSQARLRDYPELHGLDEEEAAMVGVLAAHHQGWTSCHEAVPTPDDEVREVLERFEVTPASLDADADAVDMDPDRAQLLVALLRVADGADIGRHRAPHHGGNLDAHLRSCAQHTLGRAAAEVTRGEDARAAGRLHGALLQLARDPDDAPAKAVLEGLADADDGTAQRMVHYLGFYDPERHHHHFGLHSSALLVQIEHGGEGFVTRVTPATPGDRQAALDHVRHDVEKELDRPGGEGVVRDRLARVGLTYGGCKIA